MLFLPSPHHFFLFMYDSRRIIKSKMENLSNCTVCQDSFENPKFLKCGHTFCCKCIDVMLESSKGQDKIKCPLCRKVTVCPKHKGEELMDNFFVSDRQYLSRIVSCAECKEITPNTACENCVMKLCENCISLHMKNKCIRLDSQSEPDEPETDANEALNEEGLEGQSISDHIPTKFYFELDGKIIIPNVFPTESTGNLNINVSVLHCLSADLVMVAPRGHGSLSIYSSKGDKIIRHVVDDVISITHGIYGCPILVQNGENGIYEYSYGTMQKIFSTQLHVPKAVSSLNDGRLVTVGYKLTHTTLGVSKTLNPVLCIYEYRGQLVKEISKVHGEQIMKQPTSVCINMKNNDIFVGDVKKGQVLRFREDGNYVSFFERTNLIVAETNESSTHEYEFPLSLAYDQLNTLLFASYSSAVGSGIQVLSPTLKVLGSFHSIEEVRIPAGLSCDERGKLFVGDGQDGIIRVFSLSQYMNKM